MPAFQQMGHHSENLLFDPHLDRYHGAILSPVNYSEIEIAEQIARLGERQNFQTIFDPQLYFPNSERGRLREWSYFPSDVDTADTSSDIWWSNLVRSLATTALGLGPTAVCSPVVVPRVFTDDYFGQAVHVGGHLKSVLDGSSILPIQTALVSLADLTSPGRAMAVASIISATQCDQVYLIFLGTTEPRREFADPEEIKGAMRLIAELEGSGLPVLVGFCSSDVVLWKAAGATSCATGKFFNLRRFTRSRFEEPSQGGGQLPYWFEESLLAFLRESDVLRVQGQGMISPASFSNHYGQQILAHLQGSPGSPWVGLGWRQFMCWFADFERRVTAGEVDIRTLLREAEANWLTLEDADVLMEESRNEGSWLRPWRRAMAEFRRG